MTIRAIRRLGATVLLLSAAALAQLPVGLSYLSISTLTAQVGVFYSSTVFACCGVTPYTWSMVSGALPPGLVLSPTTGAITGTPTAAGDYTFTVRVTDSAPLPTDTLAAAPRRTRAANGNPAASVQTPFTISVSPAGTAAVGAPTSPLTLACMLAGLAAIAFFRLRPNRPMIER